MDKKEIFQSLKSLLVSSFPIEEKDVQGYKDFRKDFCLDSIDMVHLQVSIEDEFGVKFDPITTDLTEVFKSVDSLTDFILFYKEKEVI